MKSEHEYAVSVVWEGDRGTGTSGYREYGRQLTVTAEGPAPILASADTPFRGDADRWNPEQLLLAALAQCHLLSYLHVAVKNGVVVTGYTDDAVGSMLQEGESGRFTSVTLRPRVTVAEESMVAIAQTLHAEASRLCFIANSVNFPVSHEPEASAR
ncbi:MULTISPECIES: OsmC family protein [unclassified Rathayibacter]|uniref:OsmC family protein n=1 Tax=unclassified Rathayibacter TaxID=2609250 RepID=UPI000CE75CA1|nr:MULTISPECIES: OsmC family protein [unclassified Rathayibacter]PPF58997.1 peroxiredoxin [Rathayibacter sp. AY1C2]PPG18627.1 peroxiredoxin [Rathayibacter sp. AY1C6]PPG62518.1 peroxiredoxin [Rathayibacter sp. AY1C7]PPH18810.1 peroxiredoxin [Rathayibacter sp. AY1F8]PPH50887.1 peroxiredoxin [Rathayibacter sp. AY1E1]